MEKVKRLQPTKKTVRELFSLSGNLCAFPNCKEIMMDTDGEFIGEMAHIEAAMEGGERFNSNMTNEERRQAKNLILLCHKHHRKTNNVKKYPVSKMQKMKKDHESVFLNPEKKILTKFADQTDLGHVNPAKKLAKLNKILGWEFESEDLKESAKELGSVLINFFPLGRISGSISLLIWRS